MRSFGVISPQFWTGTTGREIQDLGADAIVVAVYLMTSPHSHMCGLYYVSKQYIVEDTGRPIKAVEKALRDLALLPSGAFAFYDEVTRYVWVPEMMRWQVGPLSPKDSRIISIIKWYQLLPSIPFIHAFFDRYAEEIPGLQKRQIPPPSTGGERGGSRGGTATVPPHISTPGLVPVLVSDSLEGESKGGTKSETEEPKSYGEFGHAKLTDTQHAKLKAQLNGNLDEYIRRFDRWKEENLGDRKIQRRKAYLTIPNWFERDVARGLLPVRASPDGTPTTTVLDFGGNNGHREFETKAEALIRKQRESGERVRELLRGSASDGARPVDPAGANGPVRPGLVGSD